MRAISHRGLWREPEEKNTWTALARSFELGFGTETDVRDLDGGLVISHDPPRQSDAPVSVADFLALYVAAGGRDHRLPLALNIKSDGLADALGAQLAQHRIDTAFVFDMSIPDMRAFVGEPRTPVYTRHSDIEPEPSLYGLSRGVWLDSFECEDWFDLDMIAGHEAAGKAVCVVSSELHGRDPRALWSRLATGCRNGVLSDEVLLCTDWPEDAMDVLEAGL